MRKLTNNPERQSLIEHLAMTLGAEIVAVHTNLPESYFTDSSDAEWTEKYLLRNGEFGRFDCPTDF